MNLPAIVPLEMRILLLIASWLVAGFIYATCSEFTLEGGDNLRVAQAQIMCLAPLMAAEGLAFAMVPGGYNAWEGRHAWETIAAYAFLGVFLIMAGLLLTRRTRRQFVIWAGIELSLLTVSVFAVLYYFHWDAMYMHG